jgi:hypothetical protein
MTASETPCHRTRRTTSVRCASSASRTPNSCLRFESRCPRGRCPSSTALPATPISPRPAGSGDCRNGEGESRHCRAGAVGGRAALGRSSIPRRRTEVPPGHARPTAAAMVRSDVVVPGRRSPCAGISRPGSARRIALLLGPNLRRRQKINFMASWICRGELTCALMTPNCGVPNESPG